MSHLGFIKQKYETIHAQDNGSRGTHFAKFSISNFLKGLTDSAMGAKHQEEYMAIVKLV